MRRAVILAAGLLALAACSEQPAGQPVVRANLDGSEPAAPATPAAPSPAPTLAADSACRSVAFEEASFTHCIADPARHRIAMANAGDDGQPYGSLTALAGALAGKPVAFAINGGIYGDDLKPVGYYVENGERLSELDRGEGTGNFYMKPNGVFFGTGGTWRVLTADRFFASVGERPQFGTQSGPMLVIAGKLHPDIQDNGPSKAVRSGVGVDAAGAAHFVLSEGPVSFGQLARFFRDRLKTPDALALDSQVSRLWDPASDRLDRGRVGPVIVVTRQAPAPGAPAAQGRATG